MLLDSIKRVSLEQRTKLWHCLLTETNSVTLIMLVQSQYNSYILEVILPQYNPLLLI